MFIIIRFSSITRVTIITSIWHVFSLWQDISDGTIADIFLYCYEGDVMSDLHKSKHHDLIDMFNDTSRYLYDIFTIDNPEFEKYIPDIYSG